MEIVSLKSGSWPTNRTRSLSLTGFQLHQACFGRHSTCKPIHFREFGFAQLFRYDLCRLKSPHDRTGEDDFWQQSAASKEFSRLLRLLKALGGQFAFVIIDNTWLSVGVAEKVSDHEFRREF